MAVAAPRDPGLRAQLRAAFRALSGEAVDEVFHAVDIVKDGKAAADERMVRFNDRYVMIVKEAAGVFVVMVEDTEATEDGFMVVELCGHYPQIHLALQRCAQALQVSVETWNFT